MVSDSENDLNDHENEKEESDKEEQSLELKNDEIDKKKDKKEKKKKKVYKLSLEDVEDFNAKLKKRGVIYLSRIPPRMGPAKIKQLLSEHGGLVTRVYLVEEDKAARKRRLRQSGSSRSGGKRYVEGWVEFESKKIAKAVGMQLNNTPISNHKRNVHYGDLWSMKYLSKFQWSHLTEKVAYERRVREQKLRIEMMQAQRENANYTSLVQAGKTMDHIEKRLQRKRKQQNTDTDPSNNNNTKEPPLSTRMKKRSFPQTKLVQESSDKATKRAVLQSLVS